MAHRSTDQFRFWKEQEEFANFFPCRIEKDGVAYPSAEHFFQAHKTLEDAQRRRVAEASFERVYSLGRCLTLRPDWETVKLQVMLEAAQLKYQQNPSLAAALAQTKGEMTFTPSAGFWGVDETGRGENWNGRIHAAVRAQLVGDVQTYEKLYAELLARCKQM
ncbi:unnamed protein product [Effrenium voratum]|nr:unnamed protein product [Effrenium voratum]